MYTLKTSDNRVLKIDKAESYLENRDFGLEFFDQKGKLCAVYIYGMSKLFVLDKSLSTQIQYENILMEVYKWVVDNNEIWIHNNIWNPSDIV